MARMVAATETDPWRSIFGARHGAHGRSHGDGPLALEKSALGVVGLTQAERKRDIPAEDHPPFVRKSIRKTRRDGPHACDRHDAEGDAGDEHIKSAQPPAHFSYCYPGREQRARAHPSRL
jgi:hypothetical protein